MITGFASGCPTDSHEELLLGFIPSYEVGNSMRVILPITPVTGCGNQYWVFGADDTIQKILYIAEGTSQNITVILDPTRANHSVFAEPNGTWSTIGSVNIFEPTFVMTQTNGKSVQGNFNVSSEFIAVYGDLDQLSSVSLVGLSRYSTLRPDGIRKTEAECDVILTNLAGTRTVTVSLNGQTLCSGSRVGDGSITLAEVASSGVSGSIAVAYTADVTSGAFITKRYAASYLVEVGTLSKTIPDNQQAEILSFTIGTLAIGTYTLSITPLSDTGITGTATTTSVTIAGAPLPPGVPTYFSGDSTNTVIHYAASATAGATYRIYTPQEIGSPTFIETPSVTHIAGTGTLSSTLPSFVAADGDITVFVTSVNGGFESDYQKVVITYQADGTIPNAAPNIPTLKFQLSPVTNGRNINVSYLYDKTNQLALPTKIQTQIKNEAGTITTQTAAAITAFPPTATPLPARNQTGGDRTIGSGADGWFWIQARAQTAGGVNSDWCDWIGPVWCSNVVISAVTGLTTNITG